MTSPRTYRLMNFIEHNLALVLTAITIIIVERIIKFYIQESLNLGESISVIPGLLSITRSENYGGGFGMMQGQNWLFIGAAILVLALIVFYYNIIIYDFLLIFSSAFILGGTVGNLMDRLFFGHVIDYINLSFWPTFNLSDFSLSIGAVLLIVYMYRWQKDPEVKEAKYIHY